MDNSYWLNSVNLKQFTKLERDLSADVVIVGARNLWSFYCLLFD